MQNLTLARVWDVGRDSSPSGPLGKTDPLIGFSTQDSGLSTQDLVTIPKLHFTRFGSKLYNLRTRWERRARDGQTNKSNQGAADHLVCG